MIDYLCICMLVLCSNAVTVTGYAGDANTLVQCLFHVVDDDTNNWYENLDFFQLNGWSWCNGDSSKYTNYK